MFPSDSDEPPGGATSKQRDASPDKRGAEDFLSPISLELQATRQSLPAWDIRGDFCELVKWHPVVIVHGATGCGKSTQLPQFLLDTDDEFYEHVFGISDRSKLRIVVSQPRRLAAIAMGRRVALERGTSVGGSEVGFTIRFWDESTRETRLRYVTDGCLLRELVDRNKRDEPQVIFLDEAHERSLHTDVVIGILKQKLAAAGPLPKFRIIVASATLDAKRFSQMFFNAPIQNIISRLFPVDVIYSPPPPPEPTPADRRRPLGRARLGESARSQASRRITTTAAAAVRLHCERDDASHILVFLAGREECEGAAVEAYRLLEKLVEAGQDVGHAQILVLYGGLETERQTAVFEPAEEGHRKIIFSTNVAETSVTVDGVGYVIDSGAVKQKNVNHATGLETLQAVEVSQSQATQRAGRAGRTRAGICFRLYSEDHYKRLAAESTPEICRADLCWIVLQLKILGIAAPLRFPFLDPPAPSAILAALKRLFLVGAMDADGRLTKEGETLGHLPLHPSFSRALMTAMTQGGLPLARRVSRLLAILSSEVLWIVPPKSNPELRKKALSMHTTLRCQKSDHLTLLRIFERYDRLTSQRKDWCRDHFIHLRVLRQAEQIQRQLWTCVSHLSKFIKIDKDSNRQIWDSSDSSVLKCLLSGLYMQTARRAAAAPAYVTIQDGLMARPEQGSACADAEEDVDCPKSPATPWVMFSELVGVQESQMALRGVSEVFSEDFRHLLVRLTEVDLQRLTSTEPVGTKVPVEVTNKIEKDEEAKVDKIGEARLRFRERQEAQMRKKPRGVGR